MNIGRFVSWSVLAGMAIAGGLFVSDQRVIDLSPFNSRPIIKGNPLRLGVVLSDVPSTAGIHQAMTHALLLARDKVNRCGGINHTPVFLAIERDEKRLVSKRNVSETQHSTGSTEAIAQESQAMSQLIQTQDIHGAIVSLTPDPSSHGLTSDALDTAIDFNVPTVSPTNTQPLLTGPDNSPFDRFRIDLSTIDARPSENRDTASPRKIQVRAKKTKYWSRTIMSDRQHLMMVAQLAQQQGWQNIVTVGPNTDRGDYLGQILGEALQAWSGTATSTEALRYSVTFPSTDLTSAASSSIQLDPKTASSA